MAANLFAHECGAYCRNGKHAAVVWCDPDHELTPHEIFVMCCAREGKSLVHLEEAHEAGPVPVNVIAESINIETWERTKARVPANSRPYLVVWRNGDAQ